MEGATIALMAANAITSSERPPFPYIFRVANQFTISGIKVVFIIKTMIVLNAIFNC